MPLGGHSREVRGFSSQRPSSSPRSPTSYRVNPTARSDEDGRRGNKGSISLKRPFESGQYSFTLPLFFQIFNSPAVPVFRSVRIWKIRLPMSCNFYLSGGLFAGMLGKALFRWKKGRLKLCLFSLEIGKTGVIVKILINKTACYH